MSHVNHPSSRRSTRPNGHPPISWRGLQRAVVALVMLFSAVVFIGVGPSEAGPADRDTIAVVDAHGGFTVLSEISKDARTLQYYFGAPGDIPLMGDWDCDGDETPGVYRPSTGRAYLRNSHSSGVGDISFLFGNPGDRAIAGDFDGDRCDTVSVYRPHRATAYLNNLQRLGIAEVEFEFGNPGDRSFVGDFTGKGFDTIGLHRDTTGVVYLSTSKLGAPAYPVVFGNPGDQIVAGDWDGDGIDTIGAYRPSNGMFYFRNSNSTGTGTGSLYVGRGVTVVPVSGVDRGSITGPKFNPDPIPGPAPKPAPAPGAGASSTVPGVPGLGAPAARPASGPININGQSNVVIENLHISNPSGPCVRVTNSTNVTIRNSTIGPCGGDAVYLSDVTNATVSGNHVTGTRNGVLVHRSNSIAVNGNAFVNAGRNFVQFDKVNGAGSSISNNRGQNQLGGSNAEDLISVYQSNGTASSPIRIAGNYLRNGGPSNSGSGIMLGDGGGQHQIVENNVLVNPGQVGIGVASGSNVKIRNNRIFSDSQSWSNVGLYVWNQYSATCQNIEVSGNQVNWTSAAGRSNGWWSGGGCSNLAVTNNNWDAPIGPGIF